MSDALTADDLGLAGPHERRTAVLWITAEAVFCFLQGLATGRFRLPVFRDLPDDARVVSVCQDVERQRFGVLVESPQFAVVLPGMPSPQLSPVAVGFREFVAEPDAVVERTP